MISNEMKIKVFGKMKVIISFENGKKMLWALLLAGSLVSSQAVASDESAQNIESAKSTIQQWVETQRVIPQEKRHFKVSQEMLNERIELLQNEIKSLNVKIEDAEKSIAEVDKKREEMVQENETLKEASSSLTGTITNLEVKTKHMLKRLPDPIRDRVKPLSQRLPEKPQDSKLGISERFQNVVGILNEVDKFNREITAHSEVRAIDGGESFEVVSLYVGIGRAYYASANGNLAGVGYPAEDKWVWEAKNDFAQDILKSIAILKNEEMASFVKLPVEVQ